MTTLLFLKTNGINTVVMEKVRIKIDWYEHNYGAAPANEDIACVATGSTLHEVERNIVDALKFHVEGLEPDDIPAELQGEWEPVFELTTRALLRYSENFITRKALSKETGINEQQLSHYANGWRMPKPATQVRIINGIRNIARELSAIS